MKNPFKPTFGVTPPLLVGRDDLIDEFTDSLEEGPGSPGRATIYTGARGVGKTVLLNEIEEQARVRGWLVISETATRGFVKRITEQHLPELLAQIDPKAIESKMQSMGLGAIGSISWSTTSIHIPKMGLRNQLELLTGLLVENETGLLITLDELHKHQRAEFRDFATTVQHLFREECELAFTGAGLPSSVEEILNDQVLTFLRRAERHPLGPVTLEDVAEGLRSPIEDHGREIGEEACHEAAVATEGHPFMIQLVGYHSWKQHPEEKEIALDDVRVGVPIAWRRLGTLVHSSSLSDVSDVAKTFLLAMAQDDGPSKMSDIEERLGCDPNYAYVYRSRLITTGVIKRAGYGRVDFVLPYLREYLRSHGASLVMGTAREAYDA